MKNFIQVNAPHPGEMLPEMYLKPLGLTIKDAGEKLQLSRNKLSAIIQGKANVTGLIALKLSRAFNTTPFLWMNMQTNYDLSHAIRTSTEYKKIRRIA